MSYLKWKLVLMGSDDCGGGLRGGGGHSFLYSLRLCSEASCGEEKEISKLANE